MAGERILVVEDERPAADALRMRLRGLGYDVIGVALDGPTAIDKAQELEPALILMDIKLGGGMDGIETAHRIRAKRDVPIIYVSAFADQRVLERARETRPAGFINKPFTTKDLLTTIDLALHAAATGGESARAPDAADGGEDGMAEAAITFDLDGRVTSINRAAEKQTGWRRNQILGRPVAEILGTLYEISEPEAEEIVHRLSSRGSDEKLVRTARNTRGEEHAVTDVLAALRDPEGRDFGMALKFSLDTINESVADLHQFVTAYTRAIDALPLGVMLVNGEMTLLHMNERARQILAHNRGLDCRNDHLVVTDKRLQAKLQAQVRAAAASPGDAGRACAMCIRTPFAREHIELVVTPVGGTQAINGGPSVLIYVFDTGTGRVTSNAVLTELYGLTQTEANLVRLLVSGQTLDEAAVELDISVNTARTHLKHVFHKTAVNRQLELVHRVETGPAGLLLNFEAGPGGEPAPRG